MSEAIDGTPKASASGQRPAHGRGERRLAEDVEHAPEPQADDRMPAKVMRSAILSRSARRRRSTSSSPWPAITNSASIPASSTRRGRVQEGREPRGRAPAARPCRSPGTTPDGRVAAELSAGTAIPGGSPPRASSRDPRLRDQVVGQLAAGRDQPPAPSPAQPEPARRGEELVDRLDVGDSPMLGDRQADRRHRRMQDVHQLRDLQPPTEVEPADAQDPMPAMPQGRALDDPVVRARPVRPRDAEHLRRDPQPLQTLEERTDRPAIIMRPQTASQEQDPAPRSSIASPLALCDIPIRSRFDGPQPITSPRSRAAESSQCRSGFAGR